MTKTEILALPPDKLHKLVAEKVMGEMPHRDFPRLFDYSGNIEAAWRVQEKMAEKGYDMILRHTESYGDRGKYWWCCEFEPVAHLSYWVDAQPSAPEAICRAALLAVSSE
jgi:hypothetical protein